MESTEQSPVLTMAELLARSGNESFGPRLGLPTGLKGLDAAMGRLEPGTLTVLASRPGLGRSTLLQNICQWNAGGTFSGGFPKAEEREVVPILLASTEQSMEQIMIRALSTAARVSRDHLRTGELVDEDIRRLKRAQSILEAAPLYVLAPAVFTDGQLAEHARRLVREHQVQLVGVDGPEAMGPGLSLDQAARTLKTLARELAVPVIVTAPSSSLPRCGPCRGGRSGCRPWKTCTTRSPSPRTP
ncbi:hypothetical protein ACE1SV_63910 [Streptomyces sp. E-15]